MKLTSATICPGCDHRRPRYKGWNWCARPTHLSALMLLRRIARTYPLTLGVAIGTFCAHGACDKPPPPVCIVIDGPAQVLP